MIPKRTHEVGGGCVRSLLTVFTISAGLFAGPAAAGADTDPQSFPPYATTLEELLARHEITGLTFSALEVVDTITGNLSEPVVGGTYADTALTFLTENRELFGLRDPARELRVVDTREDELGMIHVRFVQTYQGLPVLYGDLRAHFSANGALTCVNGTVFPGIEVPTTPGRTAGDAARIVAEDLGVPVGQVATELVVARLEETYHLTWVGRAAVDDPPGQWEYFIDASTGDLLYKANRIKDDGPSARLIRPELLNDGAGNLATKDQEKGDEPRTDRAILDFLMTFGPDRNNVAPLQGAPSEVLQYEGQIWQRRLGDVEYFLAPTIRDVDAYERRIAPRTKQDPPVAFRLVQVALTPEARARLREVAVEVPDFVQDRVRVYLPAADIQYLADHGVLLSELTEDGETANPEAPAQDRATVWSEGFEGSIAYLTRGDSDANNGSDYWGDVSCKSRSGYWSLWSSDEGDMTDCNTYDDYMNAYVYDPAGISVSGYTNVQFSYWWKYDLEVDFDYVKFYISSDGTSWTILLNLTGRNPSWPNWDQKSWGMYGFTRVYWKFVQTSDYSVRKEGAYVDDMLLTADTGGFDCANYISLSCNTPYNGTTVGGRDYVDAYNCSSWDESGPERLHRFVSNTNQQITVTLSNLSVDLDVFLMSQCDRNSCVNYGNDQFVHNVTSGTYWIAVDGYQGVQGSYTITISCVVCTPGDYTGTGNECAGNQRSFWTYCDGTNYQLRDRTRGNGIRTYTFSGALPGNQMTDSDNSWTDTAQRPGVGGHTYAASTYDYLRNVLGRNGYDGSNGVMTQTIQSTACTDNAYWNGSQVVYCVPGTNHTSLACGTDVVAHEWGHAVTDHESNLVYEKQSGALNESFSDMLGVSVGFSSGFDADWTMGEVYDGTGFRDIANPPRFNDPDCMGGANWVATDGCTPTEDNDWCGVHTNSGVPNKMFHFLSVGGSAHGHTVTAIGRDEAMKVMYRANRDYWTSTTTFLQAKNWCAQAAKDLNATYETPTREAWGAVCVGGPDLVIDHIDPDVDFSPVTATIHVKNQGFSDAAYSYTEVKVDGTTKCSSVYTPAISVGQTAQVTCDFGSQSLGSHSIKACADITNRITEDNEANNCKTESAYVFNWPDWMMALGVGWSLNFAKGECQEFYEQVPQDCEALDTRVDDTSPTAIWFILAFRPGANPGVAGVTFGNDHNLPYGAISQYELCGPPGSIELPDPDWPNDPGQSGTTIGFGSPMTSDFFPIYRFAIEGDVGAYFGSGINPSLGYASFTDAQFPPVEHLIENFGQVRWFEEGWNECPGEDVPGPGACCFGDGACLLTWDLSECIAAGGSEWLGQNTPCDPNPCLQSRACCFPDGSCQIMNSSACEEALGIWHDDWTTCEPNPCPQPICSSEVIETEVSYPVRILNASKYGQSLDLGDQIGLYAEYEGEQVLVGSAVFDGTLGEPIFAWQKVKDPPAPGFSCDEPIFLRLCIGSTGEQLTGTVTWEVGGHYCEGSESIAQSVVFDHFDHWADHDVGNGVLTVTDQGILGFTDGTQAQGSGYVFPREGSNHLFLGGVWIGGDESYVANRDYDADPEKEWAVSWIPPGYLHTDESGWRQGTGDSDQDIRSRYADSDALTPRGLFVEQESWAYSGPQPVDDVIIVNYRIENRGTEPLTGFYAGLFLDLDIGDASTNTGATDAERDLIYMTAPEAPHLGLRLLREDLGDPPVGNVSFIDNPTYVWPNAYVLDEDKYAFLSAADPEHVMTTTPAPNDYSMLASAGPFDLAVGEQRQVSFAIIGGETLDALLRNSDVAEMVFRGGITGVPQQLALTETCLIPGVPNPFTGATLVRFDLVESGQVRLGVYDVGGRRIRKLADGHLPADRYALIWDGRDDLGRAVPAGVYWLRFQAGATRETRTLVRVK